MADLHGQSRGCGRSLAERAEEARGKIKRGVVLGAGEMGMRVGLVGTAEINTTFKIEHEYLGTIR